MKITCSLRVRDRNLNELKKIVEELNKLAEEHGEFYKPDPLLISMQE